jgi:hypothetical protein
MLALSVDARAQVIVNLSAPGARAGAMGGAFIGVADDATTAVTNPAGLSNLSIPEIYAEGKSSPGSCLGCGSSTSVYLSFVSIAIPVSSRITVAAFRNQNFHSDDADESLYAGAIGARLTNRLQLGVSAGLLQATFARATSSYGTRVSGGLLFKAASQVTVGASATHVTQNTIRAGVLNDTKVGGGVGIAATPRLLISADVNRYLATNEFQFARPTQFGAGGEFVIFGGNNDRIFLRGGGCQCNPFYDGTSASFGAGYASHQRFQVDVSYATGIKELTFSGVYRY